MVSCSAPPSRQNEDEIMPELQTKREARRGDPGVLKIRATYERRVEGAGTVMCMRW